MNIEIIKMKRYLFSKKSFQAHTVAKISLAKIEKIN
jgi:hypothetical protein